LRAGGEAIPFYRIVEIASLLAHLAMTVKSWQVGYNQIFKTSLNKAGFCFDFGTMLG
jgi:hypothetical protein